MPKNTLIFICFEEKRYLEIERIEQEMTDNVYTQIRNEFCIFKYFMDVVLAVDKAFKFKFGEQRKIASLPYFAFRDRFLFDATETLKKTIDDLLNRFLDDLIAEEDNYSPQLKDEFERTSQQILDCLGDKTQKLFHWLGEKHDDHQEYLKAEFNQLEGYLIQSPTNAEYDYNVNFGRNFYNELKEALREGNRIGLPRREHEYKPEADVSEQEFELVIKPRSAEFNLLEFKEKFKIADFKFPVKGRGEQRYANIPNILNITFSCGLPKPLRFECRNDKPSPGFYRRRDLVRSQFWHP